MTQTSPLLSQPTHPYPSKDFVHKVTFPSPVSSIEWIIPIGIWTCPKMSFWQTKKVSLDLTTFYFFLTQPISLPPFQQTSKLTPLLLHWNSSYETPYGFHILQDDTPPYLRVHCLWMLNAIWFIWSGYFFLKHFFLNLSYSVTTLPWFSSSIIGPSNFFIFSQSLMLVHSRILTLVFFFPISTTHYQDDLIWPLGFKYQLFAGDF